MNKLLLAAVIAILLSACGLNAEKEIVGDWIDCRNAESFAAKLASPEPSFDGTFKFYKDGEIYITDGAIFPSILGGTYKILSEAKTYLDDGTQTGVEGEIQLLLNSPHSANILTSYTMIESQTGGLILSLYSEGLIDPTTQKFALDMYYLLCRPDGNY